MLAFCIYINAPHRQLSAAAGAASPFNTGVCSESLCSVVCLLFKLVCLIGVKSRVKRRSRRRLLGISANKNTSQWFLCTCKTHDNIDASCFFYWRIRNWIAEIIPRANWMRKKAAVLVEFLFNFPRHVFYSLDKNEWGKVFGTKETCSGVPWY